MSNDFFAGEEEAGNAIAKWHEIARTTAAYNAYNKVYGDTMGPILSQNAENALKAQDYQLNETLNPQKVAAAKARVSQFGDIAGDPEAWDKTIAAQSSEDTRQHLQGYRAVTMLETAKPRADGSYDPDDVTKIVGTDWTKYGMTPQQGQQAVAALTAPGGSQHTGDIKRAILGAGKVVGAPVYDGKGNVYYHNEFGQLVGGELPSGSPSVQAINAGANVTKAGAAAQGANTRQGAENSKETGDVVVGAPGAAATPVQPSTPQTGGPSPQAIDQFIAKHGNNVEAALKASTSDAMTNAIANRAHDRIVAGDTTLKGTSQAPQAVLPPQIANLTAARRDMATDEAKSIANSDLQYKNADDTIAQMRSLITSANVGPGALFKDLPGSTQATVKNYLETLGGIELVSALQSQKNSKGQTGQGRVLASEVPSFKALYGSVGQDQRVDAMLFHMNMLQTSLHTMHDNSISEYSRKWGGANPYDVTGSKPYTYSPAGGTGNSTYTPAQQSALKKYGL